LFLTCTVAWKPMLAFCIEIITSDRLTLVVAQREFFRPVSRPPLCAALTSVSELLQRVREADLGRRLGLADAARPSPSPPTGPAPAGLPAAAFSCAIIASMRLLSIPSDSTGFHVCVSGEIMHTGHRVPPSRTGTFEALGCQNSSAAPQFHQSRAGTEIRLCSAD
jgi:hypothetical protein